jgi:hypothetical protein
MARRPASRAMTDITPQRSEPTARRSARPIFIVGCPRSGTTLLQLMLHAHPDIAIPPENRFLLELYDQRQRFGDLRDPDNRKALVRFIVSRRRSKLRDFGLDARTVRRQLMRAAPTVGTAGATVFSAYAAQFGKRRWGDKRPSYIQRLDTIVRLFPDAQIIHIIRDGRDCVSSLKRMPWWRGGSIKAIWTWRNAIIAGERARTRLGPDAYAEVRYEDLVRDPEPQLRRLCDFLGEAFDARMLHPHQMAGIAVPQRKVWHTATHEPVNDAAVQRWRRDLEQWELDLLEFTAARQLRRHGYELSRGRRPRPPIMPLLRFLRLHARRNVRRLLRRLHDVRARRAYAWPVAAQPRGSSGARQDAEPSGASPSREVRARRRYGAGRR